MERKTMPIEQDIVHRLSESAGTVARRHALVVDDKDAIRELVRLHLGFAGFDVTELGDGTRAVSIGRTARFDVIVLDVMLPGVDGMTVCQTLRSEGPNVDTPIVMLTARDAESDTVVGFESGADDCVAKPFGMRELLARINALMRRHSSNHRARPERFGASSRRPRGRLRPGRRIRARPRRRADQDLQGWRDVLRTVGVRAPGGPKPERQDQDPPPGGDPAPSRRQTSDGSGEGQGVAPVKVCVAGGTGAIGRPLIAELLATSFHRPTHGQELAWRWVRPSPGASML